MYFQLMRTRGSLSLSILLVRVEVESCTAIYYAPDSNKIQVQNKENCFHFKHD